MRGDVVIVPAATLYRCGGSCVHGSLLCAVPPLQCNSLKTIICPQQLCCTVCCWSFDIALGFIHIVEVDKGRGADQFQSNRVSRGGNLFILSFVFIVHKQHV